MRISGTVPRIATGGVPRCGIGAGLLIAVCFLPPGRPLARTLEVPSQYPTIQSALSASEPGDIVEVSCGVYHEHDLSMRSGVTLRSLARDPSCVAVDADSLGRGLICADAGADTRIEGLTFRNGFAGPGGGGMLCTGGAGPEIVNCVFERNTTYTAGAAGLNVVDCSPAVTNCVFQDNIGGGVTLWNSNAGFSNCRFRNEQGRGCGVFDGAPTFTGCEFSDITGWSWGGAIYCSNAVLTIDRCEFDRNAVGYGYGSGIACENCQAAITGTSFVDNAGDRTISVRGELGSVTVTDSRFEHNEGGAARIQGAEGNFIRCLFWGNHSSGAGGALYYEVELSPPRPVPASGRIEACTFAYNQSDLLGSALCSYESGPVLEECILAFQTGTAVVGCMPSAEAFPRLSCCDSFGNQWGDWVDCISEQKDLHGNFSADPLFCDASSGDFGLSADSPCLPGHHPHGFVCGVVGAYDLGCGATSTQPATWGAVKTMFR